MDDSELREACWNLACAVMALVDGAGGDDQEHHRASQIRDAILALPFRRQPACELLPHSLARELWFAQQKLDEMEEDGDGSEHRNSVA